MKSHSEIQEKPFLGQSNISAISDLLSPVPLWFTPWFSTVCRNIHTQSFKEERRNVKTLLWWLTFSALHFRLCMTIYARSFTTAAAISVWLITQSMLLFSKRLTPVSQATTLNSLQRRFSPKNNTEGHQKTRLMFHIPCVLCCVRLGFSRSGSSAETFLYCQRPAKKVKGHLTQLGIATEGWPQL